MKSEKIGEFLACPLILKLQGVRSKFETKLYFIFLSKLNIFFADAFSCNPLTQYQRKNVEI